MKNTPSAQPQWLAPLLSCVTNLFFQTFFINKKLILYKIIENFENFDQVLKDKANNQCEFEVNSATDPDP